MSTRGPREKEGLLMTTRANGEVLSSSPSLSSPSFHHTVSNITASHVSNSLQLAAKESSGLGLAVHRNNLRLGLTRDIREGQRALREENYILEDILSEKHHMVTAGDMVAALRGVGVAGSHEGDGGEASSSTKAPAPVKESAILAARKPVQRLLVRQRFAERARMTVAEDSTSLTREQRAKRAMLLADSGQNHPEMSVVRDVSSSASAAATAANAGSSTTVTGGRSNKPSRGGVAHAGTPHYTFNANSSSLSFPNASSIYSNSLTPARIGGRRLFASGDGDGTVEEEVSSLAGQAAVLAQLGYGHGNNNNNSKDPSLGGVPRAPTLTNPALYEGYVGGGLGSSPSRSGLNTSTDGLYSPSQRALDKRKPLRSANSTHRQAGEEATADAATLLPPRAHSSAATSRVDIVSANRGTVSERPRSAALFPKVNRIGGDSEAHTRILANRLAASDPHYFGSSAHSSSVAGNGSPLSRPTGYSAGRSVAREDSLVTSLNALSPHNTRRVAGVGAAGQGATGREQLSPTGRRRREGVNGFSSEGFGNSRISAANTQLVNYKQLLLEQEEMQHKTNMQRERYDALLDEALRFQELQVNFGK